MNCNLKYIAVTLLFLCPIFLVSQEFHGKAYYQSKSTLELGRWGATMSQQQKNQIAARLKNRLEKTFTLTFNKTESIFEEVEVLDAISGATDSWGKNFRAGNQYKNVKENKLVQEQEFYGKRFVIEDQIQEINWNLGNEVKKIGQYTCYKAVALIPASDLEWWSFSWNKLRNRDNQEDNVTNNQNKDEVLNEESKAEMDEMRQIIAWYTPQIPLSHGPLEFSGLPGLILEVNYNGTTMLCTKVILNPKEKNDIDIPNKGKRVNKNEYTDIIFKKMREFRENRMGRRVR
ncbi:GLPGLI family protein [Seonamhaeicola aphaedonensis]|uniref:GLPGLI family protein n=1 Tax=Seonamhaeicola aphaedonensis TaxID=1461338 RepID=A0A3D9HLN5_9FLAO|nr:GLPGLI family protein [Seonamhaeicola aphaedonensis]RED50388.1 GLPGLI family protein [Seonamhaeicola aphaedonensis]